MLGACTLCCCSLVLGLVIFGALAHGGEDALACEALPPGVAAAPSPPPSRAGASSAAAPNFVVARGGVARRAGAASWCNLWYAMNLGCEGAVGCDRATRRGARPVEGARRVVRSHPWRLGGSTTSRGACRRRCSRRPAFSSRSPAGWTTRWRRSTARHGRDRDAEQHVAVERRLRAIRAVGRRRCDPVPAAGGGRRLVRVRDVRVAILHDAGGDRPRRPRCATSCRGRRR